ncbi:hypothetical protein CRUP_006392 [Coryphaenoides rupestris]|nr:hypothetical protein CRUP_006392 [Coryphaenoides rupestris]
MLRASLCFWAFSLAGALVVSIPKAMYEFARGDNITLPCKFVPKVTAPSLVVVTWTADGGEANVPEVAPQRTRGSAPTYQR